MPQRYSRTCFPVGVRQADVGQRGRFDLRAPGAQSHRVKKRGGNRTDERGEDESRGQTESIQKRSRRDRRRARCPY